ncbi:MAG: hypothetical protein ACYCW6_08660 [Candidatus Xenobia bacterium]
MVKVLTLLLFCGLAAMSVGAQSIIIPIPHLDRHVHGMVGSLDQSYMTVIDKTNQIYILRIPANFKMPTDIQPGKYVRAVYYIDDQNQNQLVRIKLKNQKPAGDAPVNSAPGL